VASALVPRLIREGVQPILVSRRGARFPGATTIAADVTKYDQLAPIVPVGSVVYLLTGLRYDTRVWKEQWPGLMDVVIRVCQERRAFLVFFDNTYMYGRTSTPMTERTPYRPTSHKGMVRAAVAQQLEDAWRLGKVRGVIARAADLYGPGLEHSSFVNALVVRRLLEGKRPQWPGRLERLHSLTYIGDVGGALLRLVFDPTAQNQVWHLPTRRPPMSGSALIKLVAEGVGGSVGGRSRPTVLRPHSIRLRGMLDRTVGEVSEMLYQTRYDYIFDSTKFERHFQVPPTSYEQGVRFTVTSLLESNPELSIAVK